MTDMFLEKFRALVPKYLEDEWQEEDGLPAEELDAALSHLPPISPAAADSPLVWRPPPECPAEPPAFCGNGIPYVGKFSG